MREIKFRWLNTYIEREVIRILQYKIDDGEWEDVEEVNENE